MGKILTVPNVILTPPGARNVSAYFAGSPRDVAYIEKMQALFGSSMIGFYPGSEASGVASVDYSPYSFHGTYTGVTLGQPGIGDGLTCPLYDGANDFMQPPAGFRTTFNNQEGSAMCWIRNNIAWTNATARGFIRIIVDGSNFVAVQKGGASQIDFYYMAGGTQEIISRAAITNIDWIHLAVTWSKNADQVKAYYKGIQVGSTQTSLGIWVGTPAAASTVFGALTATPTGVWDGWGAHYCVLNRAATPAEMAIAAVI